MKSIIASIRPKWCELIVSGKKTIEVRKTVPRDGTPFKCYIYCTNAKDLMFWRNKKYSYCDDRSHNAFDQCMNGKVIGEFVCDTIVVDKTYGHDPLFRAAACMTDAEAAAYCPSITFGWHISDLKIYDEPKGLNAFYRRCPAEKCEGCIHLKYMPVNSSEYDYDCEFINYKKITRPPESWCYAELADKV